MGPLQSPGPNGFNAGFFQNYQNVVGPNVTLVALKFVNEGLIDTGINYTFLVLIPNIQNPSTSSDYRPISLCNVVYKFVSKTLANRIKLIVPSLISENQSAFIPSRLIIDNVILAYESIHSMRELNKAVKWEV